MITTTCKEKTIKKCSNNTITITTTCHPSISIYNINLKTCKCPMNILIPTLSPPYHTPTTNIITVKIIHSLTMIPTILFLIDNPTKTWYNSLHYFLHPYNKIFLLNTTRINNTSIPNITLNITLTHHHPPPLTINPPISNLTTDNNFL